MKLYECVKSAGGRHISLLGTISVTWVGDLWIIKLFHIEVCGIGCKIDVSLVDTAEMQ